jgi:hypothetical protein
MTETDRIKYLRIALVVVGLTFFGLWPLGIIWPSGWIWHPGGRSEYLEMIWGIYATLGVFLILASRNPMAHSSLIWFAVWSSIAHSAIMAVQSVVNRQHIGHLWGGCFGFDCRRSCIGRPDPASGLCKEIAISDETCHFFGRAKTHAMDTKKSPMCTNSSVLMFKPAAILQPMATGSSRHCWDWRFSRGYRL